jgi:hypothetical protein
MGFETQEEAESWAENMEFRADQRKEERLLDSVPAGSRLLIDQAIGLIGLGLNHAEAREVVEKIYRMGELDGRVAALESQRDRIKSISPR